MKTEATLLSEIAAAPTLREQATLVAELDALRNSKTARVQADRDWDAAGAVVEQTLSPVLAHSMHTASTDWLSDAEIPEVDANHVHANASLWFGKTSSMVKADEEEFTEQARGVARRIASEYGEQAPEAERLFMDYVAFLRRREGASGLDQIQQTIDGNNQPKTTPLPTEVFETFRDPIDPINQGVDEAQSTESAPLLNEIMNEGGGQGQPEVGYQHGTGSGPSQPSGGGSGMQVGAGMESHLATPDGNSTVCGKGGPRTSNKGAVSCSECKSNMNTKIGSHDRTASLVDTPSPGIGYLYNLDDFLRAEAAIQTQASREPSDDQEDHTSSTDLTAQAGWRDDVDINNELSNEGKQDCSKCKGDGCDNCNDTGRVNKESARKEAASGLDQVEQVIDVNNQPKRTSLPTDVAFPLIPYFAGPGKTLDEAYSDRKEGSVKIAASVEDMLAQTGSDNPMLNKTHDGSEKSSPEPTNAMEKATGKTSSLSKQAAAEYNKGARFASTWQPGQPIVRQGSVEFEAGLYAGITANVAAQEAWVAEHEKWAAQDKGIADRIEMHAAFTETLQAEAATTTDLDEMTPGTNPAPSGDTPLQGPGTPPPMAGGMDPAAPGGASPYNGAEPFSRPVAPDPGWQKPRTASTNEERQQAFRQRVQAGLVAGKQQS